MATRKFFSPLCMQLRRYIESKNHTGIVWDYVVGATGVKFDAPTPLKMGFRVHAGSYVGVINPEMWRLKYSYSGSAGWTVYSAYSHSATHSIIPVDVLTLDNPKAVLFVEVLCDSQ